MAQDELRPESVAYSLTGLVRLSKDEIRLELSADRRSVYAGLHHRNNVLHWSVYPVSDLPNDEVTRNDLERFGINLVDGVAIRGSETQ